MTHTLISHRAESDLRVIWRWTCHAFGEKQADRYLDLLDDGMRRCANAPEGNKDCSSLRSGYWSRLIRRHVVFYTFTDTEVVI